MVAFAMTTYKDTDLAKKAVSALKEFYPKAAIVVCSDEIDRLKLPDLCGAWTERWMQQALKTDANIIVKVDPDTRCYGIVTKWPMADVFGQIAPEGVYSAL